MIKLQRYTFVTILTCLAVPSLGQLILTPKNPDGLYKSGEVASWTVKPAPQSGAKIATYTLRKNGTATVLKQGTLDLSSGSATIEFKLDEPGQIALDVTPQGSAATTAPATAPTTAAVAGRGRGRGGFAGFDGVSRDGAIFDAEHIKPMLPRPDDFDDWWSSKLAQLDQIPANPQLTKIDVNIPSIEYDKITLDNINGTHIQGQLARPVRQAQGVPAKEGKFPAILQFQYAGVYALQRQWVTDPARSGWLALDVEPHDMPIDDTAAIQQMARGPLNNYQNIGNTDREKSYFLRMYLGDCQALKYLVSRPDWDGKTIVVIGDSMGGQQSFATVGLLGEKLHVTAMICHVPSGGDVGARDGGRSVAYPNWPNQPQVIQTARYFDTTNFAPRIKVPALVSVGLYDGTSPPTGVIAAFNLLSGPKELVPMHSDHSAGNQQPRAVRRQQWLAALVKGEAAPVHQSSGAVQNN